MDSVWERKRENRHNSQGVLPVCAIILISDISGQWERIEMKFLFDPHEFLRWRSQPVSQGAAWCHVCPCASGQAGGQLLALPSFGVRFKMTISAKTPCAAPPDGTAWFQLVAIHPGVELRIFLLAKASWEQLWPLGRVIPTASSSARGTQLPNFCSHVVSHTECVPVPFPAIPLLPHLISVLVLILPVLSGSTLTKKYTKFTKLLWHISSRMVFW